MNGPVPVHCIGGRIPAPVKLNARTTMSLFSLFRRKQPLAAEPPIAVDPSDKLAAYWRKCGIPLRAGATQQAIDAFQDRYQVVLPAEFAEYIRKVDGTGEEYSDDEMSSFLALGEIRPVHEVLAPSGIFSYADRFAYPDCFVFLDYFMSSWLYAVKMTADPACAGAVYRVLGSEEGGEMEASSFGEFMRRYVDDPASII